MLFLIEILSILFFLIQIKNKGFSLIDSLELRAGALVACTRAIAVSQNDADIKQLTELANGELQRLMDECSSPSVDQLAFDQLLGVWIAVGKACVALGAEPQLRKVLHVLQARWNRPMLRSLIDLCGMMR